MFSGSFAVISATPQFKALVDHAAALAKEAFAPLDPEFAQFELEVEKFVEIVGPLKSEFTNGEQTKKLLETALVSLGYDPERTYYDVPRLRVVPCDGYLSAGVSYAYQAHRDTWYAAPQAQVNWWTPAMPITADRSMAMLPAYWNRAVAHSGFDYENWNAVARPAAAQNIASDTRPHPLPEEELDRSNEVVFVGNPGDVLVFSGAQLHATIDNTSDRTRFSVDFRTIATEDLEEGRGAPSCDENAIGTTLVDFIRVSDRTPLATSQDAAGALVK
jgi:hypothetical protein